MYPASSNNSFLVLILFPALICLRLEPLVLSIASVKAWMSWSLLTDSSEG